MTAGHDPAGPAGPGRDPLSAVLGDEPLTDEERADAAFLAGHRAAAADVDLLRDQLALLADALTGDGTAPAARPPAPVAQLRRPRRRVLPLALKGLGVAAAGALVVGSGWLLVGAGRGADLDGASGSADKAQSGAGASTGSGAEDGKAGQSAAVPLGDPAYLACARLVAEGDVTGVARLAGGPGEPGALRITLRVTRAYKPARTGTEVTFTTDAGPDGTTAPDGTAASAAPPLPVRGDHVLVGLSPGSSEADTWTVGEAAIAPQRAALLRALPAARGLPCA
ncbi:hypothetical protein [Streptomyces galbus]|uniref:Anti-sigma factor n=1 Tax=Streptomyces galbus TaxID=33898 RepID=A0ABX1IPQ6_STRGB|nr:hypothetical protein [Streptomyces galbus]NKQ27270.1 hypothetical protein [Streptomyces galbus]